MTFLQNIRSLFLPTATQNKVSKERKNQKLASQLVKNQLLRQRIDIQDWTNALRSAESVTTPNRTRLMEIYEICTMDAVLSSQISHRVETVAAAEFVLKDKNGKPNEEATTALKNSQFLEKLIGQMVLSVFYGYSLVQLIQDGGGKWALEVIPRTHIEPLKGIIKLKANSNDGIEYQTLTEFNTTIFAFGYPENLGLINKAVPHVIMKRFATSCWSEFCEIFGMPTRVVKTDTGDPRMLAQAENMLRDMGSAPYLIIDESESFEFVDALNSDGAIFERFIQLCNQEISLLISGAVIGQDTQNGNYSKEEANQQLLAKLIRSDKRMVASYMNHTVVPALSTLEIIPSGLVFSFVEEEDIEGLWKRTTEAMPYFDIDADFIRNKFGIELKPKAVF